MPNNIIRVFLSHTLMKTGPKPQVWFPYKLALSYEGKTLFKNQFKTLIHIHACAHKENYHP